MEFRANEAYVGLIIVEDIADANLSGSKFFGCDLSNINLLECNLSNAQFINCEMRGAEFYSCYIKKGANGPLVNKNKDKMSLWDIRIR